MTKAFKLLFFPLVMAMRCVEEISGEGRRYRRQRRRMTRDRPPLADAEFLVAVSAPLADGILWLAVRRAAAEAIGVPAEAVRPGDRMADLWRMQWIGPDVRDFVYRLERSLGVRIARRSAERIGGHASRDRTVEFRAFAAAAVEVLQATRPDAPAEPAAAAGRATR